MEALTRLVSESLARHGFDRPLDYRRLHWSRWFRCESPHSLLSVPSRPGVFAIAEEIMDLAPTATRGAAAHVVTGASPVPPAQSAAALSTNREGPDFSRAEKTAKSDAALAAEGTAGANQRRLLAVTQFFEADDMAFTLDRMLTRTNPMRARLASGRYFVRYVAIEDESQRRSIATALNQWIANAGEKASGIGAHFATSLELTEAPVARASLGRTLPSATADVHVGTDAFVRPASKASASSTEPVFSVSTSPQTPPHLDSGAATNIHCPSPLPSGF